MALIEGAALRVLASEPDRGAFEKQRAKSQRFGESIINGAFAVAHFGALFEQLHNLRVNLKTFGHANQAVGDLRQLLASQDGIHFVLRFVAAMRIRRPVFGELAEMRDLFQGAGFDLLFLVFLANGFGHGRRVNSGTLRINFPKRGVILDAFVKLRLSDGGVIDFAMAVAAVSDDVDHYVAAESGAILGRNSSDAPNG